MTWLSSYLDRTQIVRVNARNSSEIRVTTGIAQGTVLGPLIFIFYSNDIIRSITNCKISMFADDCILKTICNEFQQMYNKLQSDLDNFIGWCSENGLKINSGKTKAMIVSTRTKLTNLRNIPSFTILN